MAADAASSLHSPIQNSRDDNDIKQSTMPVRFGASF